MIRFAIAIVLVFALVIAALSLGGDAGTASLTWLGWRVETTAAGALLLIGVLTLAALLFWRLLSWIISAPARAAREAAERRRRQGLEALSNGFIALTAGDGAEARRQAQRAETADTPALVRLLTALGAEAVGDKATARATYQAMQGFPALRLAAAKGLFDLADSPAEARARAQEAFALDRTAPWAWQALFEGALADGDFARAAQLAEEGGKRKIITPLKAERARAAARVAQAALSGTPEAAEAAARSHPDFTPGVAVAAQGLIATGRQGRAGQLIEAAWKSRAHPALWLLWRDLKTAESPAERAGRLRALATLAPEAEESHRLTAEAALVASDRGPLEAAYDRLRGLAKSRRTLGLLARLCTALGREDEARAWLARRDAEPLDHQWSEIDATGRAFAYDARQWAAVVSAYAESGELAAPRFGAGLAAFADVAMAPSSYAREVAPEPLATDADDEFGEALQPAGGEPAGKRGLFR
jgi:HemY protein